MAEPLPTCYLNGEYLPYENARISPFDRGFLFGDGAYEVMPVYNGRPFRAAAHCARLTRSLAAIRMEDPHSLAEWRALFAALIEKNGGGDQSVYWQVTRGAERGRNHAPLPVVARTVFAFSAPLALPSPAVRERGVACISAADTRWARCDIKSTALLANVLLRELSVEAHAAETILLRDGHLTEGSSSAVHIVKDGQLRTPEQSREIADALYSRGWWYAAEFGEEGDWGVLNPDWGTAFVSPEWMLTQLCSRWHVLEFAPGRNQDNQDVYVLRRV